MRRAHLDQQNGYGSYRQQSSSTHLEDENNDQTNQLADKVKALKSLTIDIGEEVREQNKYINKMDMDFDSSQGLLGRSMKRVQAMASAGHFRFIFILLAFAMFVSVVCWMIIKSS